MTTDRIYRVNVNVYVEASNAEASREIVRETLREGTQDIFLKADVLRAAEWTDGDDDESLRDRAAG